MIDQKVLMSAVKKQYKSMVIETINKLLEQEVYSTVYGDLQFVGNVQFAIIDGVYFCVTDPEDGLYLFRPLKYHKGLDLVIESMEDVDILPTTRVDMVDLYEFNIHEYL